jgi:regulator of protease activity HflC (stomatin/prohibitin superfamily)
MVQEKTINAPSGFLALTVLLGLLVGCGFLFFVGARLTPLGAIVPMLGAVLILFLMKGVFIVNPNEAKVMQFFGSYVGTVRDEGLRWVNPLYNKSTVSLRIRNFETEQLKVNDHSGSPIEIRAIVVWHIEDAAKALFEVDHADNFVRVQSESALRNLALHYAYEPQSAGEISLRTHPEEIAEKLKIEIQNRVAKAGVRIGEARISHLAYAPEIAHAMLRRQQAIAVIAARQKIVEGAVGMVQMALKHLSEDGSVKLDERQKAEMVSNLLVVLCADRDAQAVVNVGSKS